MSTLNALLSACQAEQASLLDATHERVAQWDSWLQPLPGSSSLVTTRAMTMTSSRCAVPQNASTMKHPP